MPRKDGYAKDPFLLSLRPVRWTINWKFHNTVHHKREGLEYVVWETDFNLTEFL